MFIETIYLIYTYTKGQALKNVQCSLRHKTKPNQNPDNTIIKIR